MDWTTLAALAIGALAGTGVLLLVNELLPATPALGAALNRLHPELTRERSTAEFLTRWLRRFPVPRESLALLGRTTGQYYTSLLVAALAGLALPVVAGVMLATSGRHLPVPLVAAGGAMSLAGAAGFALAAHSDVTFKARRVRREYRQVVAVYLALVAMERGAGHGSVESLERPRRWARVGGPADPRGAAGPVPPPSTLGRATELAARTVPELRDVGHIMHSSGSSGAQVPDAVAAGGLAGDQIRTEALGRAEATTGKLEIPGAVLLAILAAFVIYPLTQRVYIGLG